MRFTPLLSLPSGARRIALATAVLATIPASAAATPVHRTALVKLDRRVVVAAKSVVHCQNAHRRVHCATPRHRLNVAGRKLSAAERSYSARAASTTKLSSTQQAPVITVSGQTLSWKRVSTVTSYVFVRKVPGAPDVYSVVDGTTVTPPAVPGSTVSYSVRTAVVGSAWAREVALTYPAAATTTTAAAAPTATVQSAPTTTTSTTSTTSSVDTTSPTTTTTQVPAPAPATDQSVTTGMVAGSAITWELPFLKTLGARTARTEYDIDTPVGSLATDIENYAKAGIRPLLLASFSGRVPTQDEAVKLGTWAATYGPGGSFWVGKAYPASVAPTRIEFGNETSYSWQYSQLNGVSDWAHAPFYTDLAASYARGVKAAAQAIAAANPQVRLLAVGEQPGGWDTWISSMFAAVPDLGSYVGGWTIHPYGPSWQSRIDTMLSQAASHGAPSTIPFWITEYGIASDNGHCLSDNYGWDKCMTETQAASTLTTAVAAMRSRYGQRLGGMYLYQAHDQRTSGSSTDREGYFGALTLDGSTKGDYTGAVEHVLAG